MPADNTAPNKPSADWSLRQYTADSLAIDNHHAPGTQVSRVCAYCWGANNSPAYVSLVIESGGFEVRSQNTPDDARALAAALIEAADLCDAFEAEQCIKEERETARLNAGPINAIEIGGGVIAFEDAGEVAA